MCQVRPRTCASTPTGRSGLPLSRSTVGPASRSISVTRRLAAPGGSVPRIWSSAVVKVNPTATRARPAPGTQGPDSFTVSLIPTTLAGTILGTARVGQLVNLEVDVIAKYVERLLTVASAEETLR